MYLRKIDADTTINIDVLVLGSSHAYRGFDPRIFKKAGIKLFNFGSSGQTPLQSKFLLKRYTEQFNPKLVIIEVYPIALETNGLGPFIDLISNFKVTNSMYSNAIKINHIEAWNSLILAQMYDLLTARPDVQQSFKRNDDIYIQGGFVEKNSPALLDFSENVIEQECHPTETNWVALINCVNYCKAKAVPVLLVQTPISPKSYSNIDNTLALDSSFISLRPDFYLNANKENLKIEPNYFYDSHHLSIEGVSWFNDWFIMQLSENKMLAN